MTRESEDRAITDGEELFKLRIERRLFELTGLDIELGPLIWSADLVLQRRLYYRFGEQLVPALLLHDTSWTCLRDRTEETLAIIAEALLAERLPRDSASVPMLILHFPLETGDRLD